MQVQGVGCWENSAMEQAKRTQNAEEHPGRIVYDAQIRPIVDTPDTGDYEIDADSIVASDRLRARHPGKISWGERIGYRGYCEFSGLYSGLRKENEMEQTKSTDDLEANSGRALYQGRIRPLVETDENIGKYCIIDPVTGDYEVDANSVAARKRLRARHPNVIFWGERIGYRSYCSFGYVDARDVKR